jgi:CRP/FNR family transcriptional regulator, cyclic AMP receptor protein
MMNSNQDHASPPPDNSARKARIHVALSSCALFKNASVASLEAASSVGSYDPIPRGKPIVQQGSGAQHVAFLARGRARVERSLLSGDLLPLGYRSVGDVAGESALGGGETYAENVIAMDDCDIVRVPLNTMNTLLRTEPFISQALMLVVLQRQAEAEARLSSLLFRPVEGRVVEFLLHAADRWGVPDARGTLISAPITHLEIAKAIGSTRETVTVTLGILRKDGLLDTAGRRLIVIDRSALAKRK